MHLPDDELNIKKCEWGSACATGLFHLSLPTTALYVHTHPFLRLGDSAEHGCGTETGNLQNSVQICLWLHSVLHLQYKALNNGSYKHPHSLNIPDTAYSSLCFELF